MSYAELPDDPFSVEAALAEGFLDYCTENDLDTDDDAWLEYVDHVEGAA